MSHEQRNVGRGFRKDFQQSSQNSQYKNERAGSDSNETSVKTIHEEVMVCVAHYRENCSECVRTAKKCHRIDTRMWMQTARCGGCLSSP